MKKGHSRSRINETWTGKRNMSTTTNTAEISFGEWTWAEEEGAATRHSGTTVLNYGLARAWTPPRCIRRPST